MQKDTQRVVGPVTPHNVSGSPWLTDRPRRALNENGTVDAFFRRSVRSLKKENICVMRETWERHHRHMEAPVRLWHSSLWGRQQRQLRKRHCRSVELRAVQSDVHVLVSKLDHDNRVNEPGLSLARYSFREARWVPKDRAQKFSRIRWGCGTL